MTCSLPQSIHSINSLPSSCLQSPTKCVGSAILLAKSGKTEAAHLLLTTAWQLQVDRLLEGVPENTDVLGIEKSCQEDLPALATDLLALAGTNEPADQDAELTSIALMLPIRFLAQIYPDALQAIKKRLDMIRLDTHLRQDFIGV